MLRPDAPRPGVLLLTTCFPPGPRAWGTPWHCRGVVWVAPSVVGVVPSMAGVVPSMVGVGTSHGRQPCPCASKSTPGVNRGLGYWQ